MDSDGRCVMELLGVGGNGDMIVRMNQVEVDRIQLIYKDLGDALNALPNDGGLRTALLEDSVDAQLNARMDEA